MRALSGAVQGQVQRPIRGSRSSSRRAR